MLYLSKLGKNVLNAIANMKEGNASLQAMVWVKLARSSTLEIDQHNGYSKAIELLTKDESAEVVEVLIEFAEWLHRKKYPSIDVEDQLSLAIDVLMDIEPGWDDEDEEEGEDGERKTKQSKRSKNSKSSMTKSKATKRSKVTKSKLDAKS